MPKIYEFIHNPKLAEVFRLLENGDHNCYIPLHQQETMCNSLLWKGHPPEVSPVYCNVVGVHNAIFACGFCRNYFKDKTLAFQKSCEARTHILAYDPRLALECAQEAKGYMEPWGGKVREYIEAVKLLEEFLEE